MFIIGEKLSTNTDWFTGWRRSGSSILLVTHDEKQTELTTLKVVICADIDKAKALLSDFQKVLKEEELARLTMGPKAAISVKFDLQEWNRKYKEAEQAAM